MRGLRALQGVFWFGRDTCDMVDVLFYRCDPSWCYPPSIRYSGAKVANLIHYPVLRLRYCSGKKTYVVNVAQKHAKYKVSVSSISDLRVTI